MTEVRKLATDIVNVFELLLEKHDICVPSEEDDQREDGNSAKLYGMEYWNLVEDIEYILNKEIPAMPDNLELDFSDYCAGCTFGEYIFDIRRKYVSPLRPLDTVRLIRCANRDNCEFMCQHPSSLKND